MILAAISTIIQQNGENGLEIGDIWPGDGHNDNVDEEFEKDNGKTQEVMAGESKNLVVIETVTPEGEKQSSSASCKWFDLVDQYMHVQGAPENEHAACNEHDGDLNNESRVHIIGGINNDGLGRSEEVVNPNPSIAMCSNDELAHVEETVNPNPVSLTGTSSDGAVTMLVHAQEAADVSADVNMITNANANASVASVGGNANTNNATASDDATMLDHGSCPETGVDIVQNVGVCESENVAKRARREQEIKESLSKMVRTWRNSLEVLKDLETKRVDTLQRLSTTMTGLLDVLKK
jgi:hypothetical protein